MPRSKSKKQQKGSNLAKSGSLSLRKVEEETKSESGSLDGSVNRELMSEVEKIVSSRVYRGRKQYLVRWKGCKEYEDTWENENSLKDCSDAIKLFNDKNSSTSQTSEEEKNINGTQEICENKENSVLSDDETNESSNEVKLGKKRTKKNEKEIAAPKKLKKYDTKDSLEKMGSKKGSTVNEKENKSAKKSMKNVNGTEGVDLSAEDGKAYEVEKIIEMHTRRDGTHEFLIRWKGYRPSDDTWEPEAHLDCQDLLNKFMEKVKKAKNIPPRELREFFRKKRVISTLRGNNSKGRHQLRNPGFRPYYLE